MTQARNAFDAESLGTLEAVLDEVCLALSGRMTATGTGRPAITREQLAKLILHYAQEGESDPARLRTLVLNGIGRQ